MARSASTARVPENSIEGKAKAYMERIERVFDELDSERGEYMAKCKSLRDDIKVIVTEAKDAGVPAKALKGLIEWRKLERKQEKLAAGLDAEEEKAFEVLVEALGPLGMAAAERARSRKRKEEPGKPADGQAPEGRSDEENLAKVGKGDDRKDVRPRFLRGDESDEADKGAPF